MGVLSCNSWLYMTDPSSLSIQDYSYFLSEERIARYPLAEREQSKLLIYRNGQIADDCFRNISDHIPPGSLLIFNNTRVVEARLLFQKPTGGIIEIFCLEPHTKYAGISNGMRQKGKVWWHCLAGGASKWKRGQVLEKKINRSGKLIKLEARYVEKMPDYFIIELSWSPQELNFAELLQYAGAVPLPPYIKRPAEESDAERYQTIYARQSGSVAAPTAGLHFTENVLASLKKKNIQTGFVTLHVGAGTFMPVKSATLQDHRMHAEWIEISLELAETLINYEGRNIVAVGTTSLRTLESLYWLGVKYCSNYQSQQEPVQLGQWEPYNMQTDPVSFQEALHACISLMRKQNTNRILAKTQLLIAPGYDCKIVNGLITNFHQPGSTLLLLVAALIGHDWKHVYQHALEHHYRFLSYGDGSLLWRK